MSNDELKTLCQQLAYQSSTQDEVNAKLKELGINRRAAVHWDKSGRMFMGMIFGENGEIVSF